MSMHMWYYHVVEVLLVLLPFFLLFVLLFTYLIGLFH